MGISPNPRKEKYIVYCIVLNVFLLYVELCSVGKGRGYLFVTNIHITINYEASHPHLTKLEFHRVEEACRLSGVLVLMRCKHKAMVFCEITGTTIYLRNPREVRSGRTA